MAEQKAATPDVSGDARTPDKRIGEIAYADKENKGAKPASRSALKPELEGPAAYAPHGDGEQVKK